MHTMKSKPPNFSLEYLKSILEINFNTYRFIWKVNLAQTPCKGQEAGCLNKGYRCIQIDGKQYKEHNLIWFYITGKWPEQELDHKDHKLDNNSFDNLRLATFSQNGGNRLKNKNNTSGYKGVYWDKRKDKWFSTIMKDSKVYHCGYSSSKEIVAELYNKKVIELFGEFAYLNEVE